MSEYEDTELFVDAEQVEAAAKKQQAARLQREQDRDDFLWLMGNRQGRRIMWHLLDEAGVNASPFVSGSQDATAHNCGRLAIGLELQNKIMRLCPEKYHLMLKERMQDVRKYQRSIDGRTDD